MFKTVAYLATTAAFVAGGFIALQNAAPAAAAKISALVYDNVLGWDDTACESNPLGCLNSRYKVLQGLEKQVETSIRTIRTQKDRITALVEEQQTMVAKNAAFLNEGKALYNAKAGQPEASVTFAGKTYPSGNSFKQQLALLFQEKAGLESSLTHATELEKKLQSRLENLMVQSGDIMLAKRMVPAQIELVHANMTLADFGSNLDVINGVIKGSEAGLEDTDQLIRTTKDLMEPTSNIANGPVVSNKDFDAFLAR